MVKTLTTVLGLKGGRRAEKRRRPLKKKYAALGKKYGALKKNFGSVFLFFKSGGCRGLSSYSVPFSFFYLYISGVSSETFFPLNTIDHGTLGLRNI